MESNTIAREDGHQMHVYRWLPEGPITATFQIAHGMGEHAARYDRFARELTDAGFAVYAQDHRGHGLSAEPETWGDMGEDGWNRTIDDAAALRREIAIAHPGLPHVFMGHSMGSMLTQQYLYRHGDDLDAAIISGSPGLGAPFQLWLSQLIARFEAWRHGDTGQSELLQNMLFGKSNQPFDGPDATGFEWLSRDPTEVRRYIDDPACGFVLRAGSLVRLFAGAREARKKRAISAIPATLPIYVFSGSADPVHGEEKGLQRLLQAYGSRVEQVEYRLYPDGRHEMLNETNRDAVTKDLISWLQQTLRLETPQAVSSQA